MVNIEINIPDGQCGDYKVETFTVSKKESDLSRF
jgi:hypothetical protein